MVIARGRFVAESLWGGFSNLQAETSSLAERARDLVFRYVGEAHWSSESASEESSAHEFEKGITKNDANGTSDALVDIDLEEVTRAEARREPVEHREDRMIESVTVDGREQSPFVDVGNGLSDANPWVAEQEPEQAEEVHGG